MRHIIYCRKSSEAEDRQILSLESQELELMKLAEKENIKIDKVYKESMSAKELGRPVFNQMVKDIEKSGDVILLVWKLDRIARNLVDSGRVAHLLQKGVILKIKAYERDYLPQDNALIMAVEFGMSNQYSRDLSTNVKRGNRTKLEKGEWPNHAPLGYKNDKATKTVIVDKKVSKYIQKAFELYSNGGYNLKEISDIIYAEGLRTTSGKKMGKGQFHRMFNNPFYYGMMLRDGKLYKGNHKPLVNKDIFDKVSDVLLGRLHSKKKTHSFHLRGYLTCSQCGCMYTASNKKGHDYYYCTNGKGICDEHKKYIRSETLDQFMASEFKQLQWDEEFIEIAYQANKEKYDHAKNYTESALETLDNELKLAQGKQLRLLDVFVSGSIPKALYEAKLKELENEELILKTQIENVGKNRNLENALELIKNIFLESNRAEKEYLGATDEQKRKVVEKLLGNLAIKNQNTASIQFKMPYQALVAVGEKRDLTTMLGVMDLNLG